MAKQKIFFRISVLLSLALAPTAFIAAAIENTNRLFLCLALAAGVLLYPCAGLYFMMGAKIFSRSSSAMQGQGISGSLLRRFANMPIIYLLVANIVQTALAAGGLRWGVDQLYFTFLPFLATLLAGVPATVILQKKLEEKLPLKTYAAASAFLMLAFISLNIAQFRLNGINS